MPSGLPGFIPAKSTSSSSVDTWTNTPSFSLPNPRPFFLLAEIQDYALIGLFASQLLNTHYAVRIEQLQCVRKHDIVVTAPTGTRDGAHVPLLRL